MHVHGETELCTPHTHTHTMHVRQSMMPSVWASPLWCVYGRVASPPSVLSPLCRYEDISPPAHTSIHTHTQREETVYITQRRRLCVSVSVCVCTEVVRVAPWRRRRGRGRRPADTDARRGGVRLPLPDVRRLAAVDIARSTVHCTQWINSWIHPSIHPFIHPPIHVSCVLCVLCVWVWVRL